MQVGEFVARREGDRIVRQGGNVASYFCTPDGRVIHVVAGPVNATHLLKEARWAVDQYEAIKDLPRIEQNSGMKMAHEELITEDANNWQRNVTRMNLTHQLLRDRPLAPLEEIYKRVFEEILNERVRDSSDTIYAYERARSKGRPILFLFRDNPSGHTIANSIWPVFIKRHGRGRLRASFDLLEQCEVIMVTQPDMPALSQLTGQPPYELPEIRDHRAFAVVITNCLGEQRGSFSLGSSDYTYLHDEEQQAIATALVESMEKMPQNWPRLLQAQQVLAAIDPTLAERLDSLIDIDQESAEASYLAIVGGREEAPPRPRH